MLLTIVLLIGVLAIVVVAEYFCNRAQQKKERTKNPNDVFIP